MCGIAGKIWLDPERPADLETVRRMTDLLVHRGPDEGGVQAIGPAALGHRRLKIIDLEGGRQPISNEDGRIHVVYNGEIYNYRDLTRELTARGHRFATRCDTEVIAHLYEDRGADLVERLRGMFAFAVWDSREGVLTLARDRVGKKPLYWALGSECVVFASEMKALLVEPSVERRLDPRALCHYLAYQYVPAPMTIFEGIEKLEPAEWIRIDFTRGEAKVTRRKYWSPSYEPKSAIGPEEAVEATLEKLDEAVAVRLESEVPLGVMLSGGVDSSAVVAMARRHVAGSLKTFSIGFREATHNELPYARKVAERYETEHEEFIVEPDAIEELPRLVWHFDEPFADSSALPTYYLSRMTRRHVTVALNGDGGDESFAGYERYRGLPIVERFEKIPRAIRAGLIAPLARAGRAVFPRSAFFDKLGNLIEISLADFERHYLSYLTIFPRPMRERLWGLDETLLEPDAAEWALAAMSASDARAPVDRMMACDVATYLPGALLVKADRMAMAVGLEGRSPFLDHELMEFAARLPAEIKMPGTQLKALLKRALEPHLPREVLYRPKQGFGVPLADWFRGELKGLVHEALLGDRARGRGLFEPRYVRRLVEDHISGRYNHAHRLWTLLMFEMWAQTFLDPPSAPTAFVS